MLIVLVLAAIAITLYYWLALPRLRRLPWWHAGVAEMCAILERAGARARAFCGNSKTIAVAYAAELGAESAGRVMVIMGALMILLRLVTRTAVSFKAEQ
jgi:hypothetical protein